MQKLDSNPTKVDTNTQKLTQINPLTRILILHKTLRERIIPNIGVALFIDDTEA